MSVVIRNVIFKFLSIFMSVLMLFGISVDWFKPDSDDWNTEYACVFVHGLKGWGSYDAVNSVAPYWGMFGGDLMEYLNEKGFTSYSASVSPEGSAWDRACELYAQLTGTLTDYGKAHSEKYSHERYGTDYTGKKLIAGDWSAENKLNLFGHSFGGTTIRMLTSLMEYGEKSECAATGEDTSELFKGGKGEWIYSVTTLSTPNNGTTALFFRPSKSELEQTQEDYRVALMKRLDNLDYGKLLIESFLAFYIEDGEIAPDNAYYDMYIDNMSALNEQIKTVEDIYYFAVPCVATSDNDNGTCSPNYNIIEPLFWTCSEYMGKTELTTPGGYVCDSTWFQNDGLVNTISGGAPFNAKSSEYDADNVEKGIWNVMPAFEGDHMSLQGDMLVVTEVKDYYVDAISMLNRL